MADDPSDAIEARLVAQAASLFEVHDNVSRVISNLDLPVSDFQDEYDITMSDSFDFEAMVRLYLYKEVSGLNQEDVTDRVQKWSYLQLRFGLDRAPTQQALSYTERNRFSLGLRRLLGKVADGIHDAGSEEGIQAKELASPDTNPSPDEIEESSTPIHHYVDNQAPDIISAALDDVCPALDTQRRHNTVHDDRTVWEHQILMSLSDRAGTRSAFRTFNKFRGMLSTTIRTYAR
ncbi:hypothetical protein ACFQL4_13020 [Halosimplex aquaticum]